MGWYLHALQICDTNEVTGVDDAGIGLAQLQFAENAAHILFFGHDIGFEAGTKTGAKAVVLRGIGQKLTRVPPDGHGSGTDDNLMAGLGQLQQGFDLGQGVCARG